jgi:proliferating cell nuclear antigen
MLFEISDSKKCDIFVHIFNHLKHFTDNIVFTVSPERLYIQGMDTGHICVYELMLQSDWFQKWEVDNNQTFGISLPILNKILRICSDKQTIIIHSDDDTELQIDFTSEEKGTLNKYLKMPLMDIDVDQLHIPEMDYDVDIELDSKKFKGLIDELSNFNETLNIDCDGEKMIFESSSGDGSMKVVITTDDVELLAVVENKEIKTSYGIKFISQMCQFYKIAPTCAIHITEDIPIQIKYVIDGDSIMRFYLAPKINND